MNGIASFSSIQPVPLRAALRQLSFAFFVLLFPITAVAVAPLVVTRPAVQHAVDSRYDYYWEILTRSLKATEPDFGSFELKPSASVLDEQRALEDLETGSGDIDILVHGNVRDYETRLLPIRFPLDKRLLGYRVSLIRADMQPVFDRSWRCLRRRGPNAKTFRAC